MGERRQAVTITGEKIAKSGMMTGGGLQGIVNTSKRWDQKDIDTLKSKRDYCQAQIDDIEKNANEKKLFQLESSTIKNINVVKNKISNIQSDIQYFGGKVESVIQQKQQAKRTLDQKIPELENVKKEIEKSEKAIEE